MDSFTPEQAKEMACPETYVSLEGFDICIGDKCMAWRWSQSKQTEAHSQEVIKRCKVKIAKGDKGVSWVTEHNALLTEIKTGKHPGFDHKEGYCGRAGYPHNALKP